MDDYFFWMPLVEILIAIVCFLVVGVLLNEVNPAPMSLIILFLFGMLFLTTGLKDIYENGNGKPITIAQTARFHRLVVGEIYTKIYATRSGGQTHYLLLGVDGVRYYTTEEVVPRKFLVQKDYTLKEID